MCVARDGTDLILASLVAQFRLHPSWHYFHSRNGFLLFDLDIRVVHPSIDTSATRWLLVKPYLRRNPSPSFLSVQKLSRAICWSRTMGIDKITGVCTREYAECTGYRYTENTRVYLPRYTTWQGKFIDHSSALCPEMAFSLTAICDLNHLDVCLKEAIRTTPLVMPTGDRVIKRTPLVDRDLEFVNRSLVGMLDVRQCMW